MVGGVRTAARWAALPLVPFQGLQVSRTAPRLPEAEGRRGSVGEGADRLRLVVLGDSLAAGVGLAHHRDSVAGQVATRLAERTGATVEWEVRAASGHTAGEVVGLVDRVALAEAAVVLVSVGVNDTKDLHSRRRFRRELADLLDAVLAAAPAADVLLLGVPPMELFPALPSPLADVLGRRSRQLDADSAAVAASRPWVSRVTPDVPATEGMFAPDGFHPSAALHGHLADAVVAVLDSRARTSASRDQTAGSPR